jgi:single-strand DNA-binding protein
MAGAKVSALGNLGSDAEVKQFPSGDSIVNFRIACTEKFKKRDGEKGEHTEWVGCVLRGKRGEALLPYLTKGTKVYVRGALRTREYQKRDGTQGFALEVNVDELELLGGGNGAQARPNGATRHAPAPIGDDPYGLGDDSLPF